MSDSELLQLRSACIAVAALETSCWPKRYATLKRKGKLPSPLWGHCAPVALMIRGLFGGDLIQGEVDGVRHFWNLLPDGREVDLTSCQFGGDGISPMATGKVVEHSALIPPQFLYFAWRVQQRLVKGGERE